MNGVPVSCICQIKWEEFLQDVDKGLLGSNDTSAALPRAGDLLTLNTVLTDARTQQEVEIKTLFRGDPVLLILLRHFA